MMKINLILLASGDSTRFKSNKLLTEVNNKPMYMNVVTEVLKINFNKIVLVTKYDEIKASLLKQPIEVVMNKNSELGISHSIELAMKKDVKADAYMFMVCDQPFITSQTIEKLIRKFVQSKKGMACVEFNGRLGNPTIFEKKYVDELLNLNGDVGGKAVMKNHLEDLEIVAIENEIEIKDIDTVEELINISNNKYKMR